MQIDLGNRPRGALGSMTNGNADTRVSDSLKHRPAFELAETVSFLEFTSLLGTNLEYFANVTSFCPLLTTCNHSRTVLESHAPLLSKTAIQD